MTVTSNPILSSPGRLRRLFAKLNFKTLLGLSLLVISLLTCPIRSAAQPPANLNKSSQNDADYRPLIPDEKQNREILGGDVHHYQFMAATGDYIQISILERDIDLTLSLFGPDGEALSAGLKTPILLGPGGKEFFPNETGLKSAREIFQHVAKPGAYVLEVRSIESPAKLGHYTVFFISSGITELPNVGKTGPKNKIDPVLFKKAEELYVAATKEFYKNNLQFAIETYERAIEMFNKAGDAEGEARSRLNCGIAYSELGEKQRAIEYFIKVLKLLENDTWPDPERRIKYTAALISLAVNYKDQGQYRKALETLFRAAPYAYSFEVPYLAPNVMNLIGGTYDLLGDSNLALIYFRKALGLCNFLRAPGEKAAALTNIGRFYLSRNESQKALEYFDQALGILGKMDERDLYYEVVTLMSIGDAHVASANYPKGLDQYNQALAIGEHNGYKTIAAESLQKIGTVYRLKKESSTAMDFFNRAIAVRKSINDEPGQAKIFYEMGLLQETTGNAAEAIKFYQAALKINEGLRNNAGVEELKIYLANESQEIYQRIISLTFKSRPAESFELSERARARAFLDGLSNVKFDRYSKSNPELVQQEQELRLQISTINGQYMKENSRPSASQNEAWKEYLRGRLLGKMREYDDLVIRLKTSNPEYASVRGAEILTVAQIQELLTSDTTLLSFFVLPKKTIAFVISKNSLNSIEIPVGEKELRNHIDWFRSFDDTIEKFPASLRELYKWLILPLKPYLKTPKIGIIPHGVLHYLPFAALTDGVRFFGDEKTLFTLPSASILPFIKKKGSVSAASLLAVAKDRNEGLSLLTGAAQEVNTIAGIYKTKSLIGPDATESAFKNNSANFDILLIAAHGELNSSNSLFSRIILTPDKTSDGLLEVHEIYDLDLSRTSLVVLSACETQLGGQTRGDEIIGLNRAFIYAGASTVVASLWNVDDESTKSLMTTYFTLLKAGKSKAEALRAAQATVRAKYPNPYFWAPFILTGNPD
jgi:CHAT domain-containing protein/Flp pilus assembly protein TadD